MSKFLRFCDFYFTALEPFFAVAGTYLILTDPLKFLQTSVTPTQRSISPTEQALLFQIAALYLLTASCGAFVLRYSRDRRLWRPVIAAFALCDIGHLISATTVTGVSNIWSFWLWERNEAVNNYMLWFGLLLRIGWFVLG